MFPPSYLGLLESGELARRVEALDAMLASCNICPWDCRVDRIAGQTKVCVAGYLPIVSSWAPHFGEEPALSGSHLPTDRGRPASALRSRELVPPEPRVTPVQPHVPYQGRDDRRRRHSPGVFRLVGVYEASR